MSCTLSCSSESTLPQAHFPQNSVSLLFNSATLSNPKHEVFLAHRHELTSSSVFIDPFVTSTLNGSSIINWYNQGGKERLDEETEGNVFEGRRTRGRLRTGQFPVCQGDSATLPAEETD